MKIRVSVLASGSSGNSIYISSNKFSLLIDAGLSGKEINHRLKKIGVCAEELDAVLVTHEHSDHIKGVGVLSRRYDLPIYANELTWQEAASHLGKIKEKNCQVFEGDFSLGNLGVSPFSTSHDAASPVGYIISCGKINIGVATDTGYISRGMEERLRGLDLLVIEANHDLDMLMNGGYPWHLKKRINGDEGHLSNDAAAALLPRLINSNFPRILLAHLSKDNNRPELAYITVKNSLENNGIYIDRDLKLDMCCRDKPTGLYELG